MISKGDNVRVIDNSYAVEVGREDKLATPWNPSLKQSEVFKVIATGFALPADGYFREATNVSELINTYTVNDTIIRRGDKTYFIRLGQLEKVKDYDKLSENDKIIAENGFEYKILLRDTDSDGIVYVARCLNRNHLSFIRPSQIKEVIYNEN